jgi:ubiquinone biosynthesis protein
MGDLERGGIEFGMRPAGYEPLVERFERLGNRIVLGVIVAAFINGIALLLATYRPGAWEQWSTILLGFGLFMVGSLGA